MPAGERMWRAPFAPRRGVKLEGKRVLLVDDVMTTGATESACARALKLGGSQISDAAERWRAWTGGLSQSRMRVIQGSF